QPALDRGQPLQRARLAGLDAQRLVQLGQRAAPGLAETAGANVVFRTGVEVPQAVGAIHPREVRAHRLVARRRDPRDGGDHVRVAQRLGRIARVAQRGIALGEQRNHRGGQPAGRLGIAGGRLEDLEVERDRRVRAFVQAAFGQRRGGTLARVRQRIRRDLHLGHFPGERAGQAVVAGHLDPPAAVGVGLAVAVGVAPARGHREHDQHGEEGDPGKAHSRKANRLARVAVRYAWRVNLWIEDPKELSARLADAPPRVGMDTEFVRERTWWPRLALVQLAVGDDILLADPLAPGIGEALAPLLADPAVLKVMHSASEDLVALKRGCGVVPAPLFDTQVAAALAGVGAGIGYQRLVLDTTGSTLPKGETRSDWLRRPLSSSQLEYAADDVLHLDALHADLERRLRELDRLEWLAEDCARMVAGARDDALDRWPHLGMRAAQFMDAEGQRRLLRLLRWRDAYARDHDRPRGWILDNELAASLARNPPADRAGLQRQLEDRKG